MKLFNCCKVGRAKSLHTQPQRVERILKIGCGVNLPFLLDFVSTLKHEFPKDKPTNYLDTHGEQHSIWWGNMRTTDLCALKVVPETKGHGSFASMLQNRSNKLYSDLAYVAAAPPNHFVSHAWSYVFVDLVSAIEDFVQDVEANRVDVGDKPRSRDEMFFWIDLFAVDQNSTRSYPSTWWKHTFQQAIADIDSTVLVLQPWSNPKPLRRSWCLWEMFSTRLANCPLHVRMTPTEQRDFIVALQTNFDNVLQSLSAIDVQQAEAGRVEVRDVIRQNVREGVGFEEMNQMIKDKIRRWLCLEAINAIQKMPTGTPDTSDHRAKLQVRVGSLLMSLDEKPQAVLQLKEALETLEKLHGPHKDANSDVVAECVGLLAQHAWKTNEYVQADEYFKSAIETLATMRKTNSAFTEMHLSTCLQYALMLQEWGKMKEAEEFFSFVVAECERCLKPESQLSIKAMSYHARFLRFEGRLQESYQMMEKVIQLCEKHGEKSSLTLDCKGSMATTLKNLARRESNAEEREKLQQHALSLFQVVWQGRSEVFGELHRDTLKSMHDWAKLLVHMGRFSAAQKKCEEALSLLQKKETASHIPIENNANPQISQDILLCELKLTIAKILVCEGQHGEGLTQLKRVHQDYVKRLGHANAKTFNAMAEIGHVTALSGSVREGKDIMQVALDGLVNTCHLQPTHYWVSKLQLRLGADYGKQQDKPKVPRAVVFDCGTNESKALLCTVVDGLMTVVEVGDKLEPMLEYLRTKQAYFATEMNKRALAQDVETVYIGMTAWYRRASETDQQNVMNIINQAQTHAASWTIEPIYLNHMDEARFEAIAVAYAAKKCHIPKPDLLFGSGGGSVQISKDITSPSSIQSFGIERGFKEGQNLLLEKGLSGLAEFESSWKATTAKFKSENTGFKVLKNQNVVGISACYFGAEAAGITESSIVCEKAVQTFESARGKILAAIESNGGGISPDNARIISNLTVQKMLFSELVHPTSTIRFVRNWKVDGKVIRTSWPLGWFLSTFGEAQ